MTAKVMVFIVIPIIQASVGTFLAIIYNKDLLILMVYALPLYAGCLAWKVLTWRFVAGRPAFRNKKHRDIVILVMIFDLLIYVGGIVGLVHGWLAGAEAPYVALIPFAMNASAIYYVVTFLLLYGLPDVILYSLLLRDWKRDRDAKKMYALEHPEIASLGFH